MRSASNTPSVFDSLPPLPPDNWYERFQDWCDRHKVAERTERYYPKVIAAVGGLVAASLSYSSKGLDGAVTNVLPTALSVVSIFAGFQAISLSIMIGASTTEVAKRLSRWGELSRVADYLWESILAVVLFTLMGIGFLMFHSLSIRLPLHSRVEPGLLASTFVWAILATIRLSHLMVKLFRYHLEHLGDQT